MSWIRGAQEVSQFAKRRGAEQQTQKDVEEFGIDFDDWLERSGKSQTAQTIFDLIWMAANPDISQIFSLFGGKGGKGADVSKLFGMNYGDVEGGSSIPGYISEGLEMGSKAQSSFLQNLLSGMGTGLGGFGLSGLVGSIADKLFKVGDMPEFKSSVTGPYGGTEITKQKSHAKGEKRDILRELQESQNMRIFQHALSAGSNVNIMDILSKFKGK